MPAPLPPTSGYTYCVELGADEAQIKVNGKDVIFDQPVVFYVENFLNFPVGMDVPVGYYDRDKGQWMPSDNGRIIKIMSITDGKAEIDTDGDDTADNGNDLGVTDAERQRLASLYSSGQSLWRVTMEHLSTWDCNWPFGPPDGATAPKQEPPMINDKKDPDTSCGSTIGIQNQTLGEERGITGTPFSLHYQSDRVPGRIADASLNIPLSGTSTPASLRRIELEVTVAGRIFTESFAPAPNLTHTFTWDSKDAYGRTMQGRKPVHVRIGYTYEGVYYQSYQRFGYSGNGIPITGNLTRQEATLWQEWNGLIGSWDNLGQGLGGWTINVHHAYDPSYGTIYYGNGTSHDVKDLLGSIITTVAGTGLQGYSNDGGQATQASLDFPKDVAFGDDGSMYIADTQNHRIRRVGTDGIISTVVGTGDDVFGGYSGDGGLAINATLSSPSGVTVGEDGSLYIADTYNNRIRRVGTDGIITTVAGNGVAGYSGDGGPATQASLDTPVDITLGGDGSLFIVDKNNGRIRRVSPDGNISTVAGTGYIYNYNTDEGGLAIDAGLNNPEGVAVGADGSLYIADTVDYRVLRVGTDGIITTVAGNGVWGYSGDGGPATQANLRGPNSVVVSPDGSLYIADLGNFRIRKVSTDGIITAVAGNGVQRYSGDGGLATQAGFYWPYAIALGPDGSLCIADEHDSRIRMMSYEFATQILNNETAIPSENGNEVYVFDTNGRHLRTLNAFTNALIYEFQYNNTGYVSITDGDGNVTTIERDGDGNPTAIVAPFGQRTTLILNDDGYLEKITNPAGESIQLGYTDDGLLTSLTDARGNAKSYTYDAMGRLIKDADPVGGFTALDHTETGNDYEVTKTTAEGVVSTYKGEHLSTGEEKRTNSLCCGNPVVTITGTDGTTKTTYPDGTVMSILQGPDPRFSMQSPILSYGTVTTPAGLVQTITGTRTVTLSDANDPLSLQSQTDRITVNGKTTTTVFDASTKTTTTTTPEGRIKTTTMDDQGRLIKAELSGLAPVIMDYDTHGRLTTFTVGTGTDARVTAYSYDANGYPGIIKNSLLQDIRFEYDDAGRTTKQILPDSTEVGFDYDANGNMTFITPPGKPDHSFTYTKVNLKDTYDPPALGTTTTQTQYEQTLDRKLSMITRPDGKTVQFDYDSKGKLDLLTMPDDQKIDYEYGSETGRLTTITAPGGETLDYSYDGSLPLSVMWAGTINGSVSQAYNNDFRVTTTRINGGSAINFQYDLDGLITGAGSLVISRNNQNGLITDTTLGNMTDTLDYNGFGELSTYQASYNGTAKYSSVFMYDKLGRITEKTETVDGVTHSYAYGYDLRGQLKEVKKDNGAISSYLYDDNGNRLSLVQDSGTKAGAYDDQDRLLSYGTYTYTYTANGELLTKTETSTSETTSYVYDVLGNLKSVSLPNGTQIEYVIDGKNRRIGKKVNGTLTQGFLYQNSLKPIAELDGSNNIVSRFVYGTKGIIPDYMIRDGVTYRIISDHLGSPRLVISTVTEQVVQQMDYDEFGNVTNDTNPGFQPFGFAGGLYDTDTKLVRFGARDYDAETGRWTAKDPIGFNGGDVNLYRYVLNNPINWIDSHGLFLPLIADDLIGTGLAGVGAAVLVAGGAPVIGGVLIACGIGWSVWSPISDLFVHKMEDSLRERAKQETEKSSDHTSYFNRDPYEVVEDVMQSWADYEGRKCP